MVALAGGGVHRYGARRRFIGAADEIIGLMKDSGMIRDANSHHTTRRSSS